MWLWLWPSRKSYCQVKYFISISKIIRKSSFPSLLSSREYTGRNCWKRKILVGWRSDALHWISLRKYIKSTESQYYQTKWWENGILAFPQTPFYCIIWRMYHIKIINICYIKGTLTSEIKIIDNSCEKCSEKKKNKAFFSSTSKPFEQRNAFYHDTRISTNNLDLHLLLFLQHTIPSYMASFTFFVVRPYHIATPQLLFLL